MPTAIYVPEISIHAPVKGATARRSARVIMPYNFNPRSREGSDVIYDAIIVHHLNFNPRSREGSDLLVLVVIVTQTISIHAPVKGATAKITKTIPNDLRKINNYNNSFTQICAKHNCKFDIR